MRITKSKLSNCHIVLSIFEYLSKLLFRSASLTSFIRSEKCYRDELVNHTPVHARPTTHLPVYRGMISDVMCDRGAHLHLSHTVANCNHYYSTI